MRDHYDFDGLWRKYTQEGIGPAPGNVNRPQASTPVGAPRTRRQNRQNLNGALAGRRAVEASVGDDICIVRPGA